MTAPTVSLGLEQAPTAHPKLLAWVREVAELTTPDRIVWVDGSDAEWQRLTDELVASGTLVRLNPEIKPNSFWARTDPTEIPNSVANCCWLIFRASRSLFVGLTMNI